MGLASSQARLLLLTARKSDLEYKAQVISQRKILLAMQTQELATDYTRALSNSRLYFVYAQDANENKTISELLSYTGLTGENSATMAGKYIVTDAQGRLVVPSLDNVPSGFKVTTDQESGKSYATYYFEQNKVDENGQIVYKKDENGNPTTTPETIPVAGQRYEVLTAPAILNPSLFQNGLQNGSLFIDQWDTSSKTFKANVWQSDDNFQTKLYTEDDDIAQAKYEASSLKLQNQDKMLDMELKQIETQHKAIETEYDSVKKVIDKNIEVSYKIFAQG